MRKVTSEFGGASASLVNRLRRLEATIAPRIRYIWVEPGEDIGPKRAALIASGEEGPNTQFVPFSWKPPQDDPQAQAPIK